MPAVVKDTLREIERELETRRRDDPLKLVYKPHGKQLEFHRSRTPLTLVLGGNRSGKSFSAVADAILYCLGRSTYAEVPEPPVAVYYVMPSLTMFKRAIMPIFKKLAPMSDIRRIYDRETVIKFKNGSELHFISADMRQRRLQGFAADRVYIDETPDEEVFEEMQARIADRKGTIAMVFSPIDVATFWVRDKLYNPWLTGERTDINVIHMPVADENGVSLVPWFNSDDIKKMEQQWPDPNVRAARMYGQFITRSGLVFRSFEKEIHVVTPFKLPREYARWMVIDPQYHRFASLYYGADEHGTYYVTDEYFSQNEPLAGRAERLASIVGKRDRPIPAYVDSANPQDVAELNWHFNRIGASLAAIPLPFQKNIEKMVLRTHALLEPDPARRYPEIAVGKEPLFGAPRILLFNSLCSTWRLAEREMLCSRLLWELGRLSWGKHGKPDKDSADGADCCDCFVYGCSILQTGSFTPDLDAWKSGMRPDDVFLWTLIDRADGRPTQFVRED